MHKIKEKTCYYTRGLLEVYMNFLFVCNYTGFCSLCLFEAAFSGF